MAHGSSTSPSANLLQDANVLLTGGTGSFGNAFVSHLIGNDIIPRKLIVFSRDELKQFEMQQKFPREKYPFLRFFIGDVRDEHRLNQAMQGVEYVVHAAAMKQVPASEYNPFECIKTNILGAQNVVNAAISNRVKRVVALSTDKAANPINLYGTTKLASDKLFIAANHMSVHSGTHFSVVRYGNVVGSRGSVIPYFQSLLDSGSRELPVTDTRMTRFWITLEQGCQFVMTSLMRMHGGETFVPKIPSMSILEIAKAMCSNCKVKVVGVRPGEKLHEMMIPRDLAPQTLEMEDHYVIQPSFQWWDSGDKLRRLGAKPVDPDFEYSSDKNSQWLSAESLRDMIRR